MHFIFDILHIIYNSFASVSLNSPINAKKKETKILKSQKLKIPNPKHQKSAIEDSNTQNLLAFETSWFRSAD